MFRQWQIPWRASGGSSLVASEKSRVWSQRLVPAESAEYDLSRVHRVASLLKRWILGTHQGAVSPEHLDGYLDEFVFRFNRRTSRSRGKLFYRLLQNAMAVEPAPYKEVIKGIRSRKPGNHSI
jgi:hypothetical protein